MLTTSDFVHLLCTYRPEAKAVEALGTHTIRSWRGTLWPPLFPQRGSTNTPRPRARTDTVASMRVSAPSTAGTLQEGDLGVTQRASLPSTASAKALPASQVQAGQVGGGRLICVDPEDSLLAACQVLQSYGIHRLPVVYEPQQSVLAVLTHRAVLRHVVEFFAPSAGSMVAGGVTHAGLQRGFFTRTPFKLGIGTYSGMVTAPATTPLVEVLGLMARENVSAVPLTGEGGVVVDIFTREDVMVLALDESLSALPAPVADTKRTQQDMMSGDTELVKVSRGTTMQELLQTFGTTGAHRVVEVDESGRCSGVISLSDVFGFVLGSLSGRVGGRRRGSSTALSDMSDPGSMSSGVNPSSSAPVESAPPAEASATVVKDDEEDVSLVGE